MSFKIIQATARLLARLIRDQRGSQLVLITLMIPPIIGLSALAVDGGVLAYDHMTLQAAADAAAASAVQRYQQGGASPSTSTLTLEGEAIAAQYGFVNGTSGVTVTVNWPPTGKITSGGSLQSCIDENLSANDQYFGDSTKIEVIIAKPISRYLSTIWSSNQINICGRAIGSPSGGICILALDPTADGAFSALQGSAITLTGCGLFSNSNSTVDSILVSGTATIHATNGGTIGAAGGIECPPGQCSPTPTPNLAPVPDPYASVTIPTPGAATTFSAFTYSAPSTVNCGATTTISSPLTSPFTLTAGTCYTGPGGNNHGLINISTGGCLVAPSAGTYTFKGTGGIQISATPPSGGSCNGKSLNMPSTATLNVSGPIVFGSFTSAQSINLNLAAFNIGGMTVNNNATLTIAVNSASAIVNGPISVNSGGSLTISPATNVATTVNVNGGSANSTAISNSGTLNLNSNSGSGSLSYVMNGGISSSGTSSLGSATYQLTDIISVTSGTLTLNPGTYTLNDNSGSAAAIDVNGSLTFNAGTFTMNIGAQIEADGNGSQITFNSGGNYQLASGLAINKGTITFASGSSTFSANDGPSHGAPSQMKGGTLSLSSGTYTFYGGITNTQQGATINITGTSSLPSTVIFSSTSSTGNTLSLHGSGSITANFATLVFTSSSSTNIYPSAPNYSMIDLPNGSSATLSAPTTGSTHGIALLGDRRMPVGTQFYIENGANLVFTGAIYLPKGTLAYQGGGATTTSCSQLVANRFQYTNGTASYANSCFSTGVTQVFIPGQGTLVE